MKVTLSIFLIPLLLLLSACATPSNNRITQVATLEELLAGKYNGYITLEEISSNGDFGLGTYHALDGEMVLLDGEFYQVRSDGKVLSPAATTRSPFAMVVNFVPDFSSELTAMTLDELTSHVDSLIPDQNRFLAIRIEGEFVGIQTRSPRSQRPPYPPLADALKTQAVFELENVKGTLVGFRCPPYVKGVNLPGYHFHFISEDRLAGGHVLSFDLQAGRLSADTEHDQFILYFPGQRSP